MFQESKENGFVMVRRNLLPHLIDGRLSMNEFAVYLVLILLADSDSGQTKTCARALHAICHPGQQLNLRGMQRILDRLEEGELIHRDLVQGERGIYRVTVNKYPITFGERKGINVTLLHNKRCKKGYDLVLRMGLTIVLTI
jgi:hypothetical protein